MVAATGANYGESNGVRVRLWWVKSTQSQTLTDAFFCKLNRYFAFPWCPDGDVCVCSIDSHVQLISMNGIQDEGGGGQEQVSALRLLTYGDNWSTRAWTKSGPLWSRITWDSSNREPPLQEKRRFPRSLPDSTAPPPQQNDWRGKKSCKIALLSGYTMAPAFIFFVPCGGRFDNTPSLVVDMRWFKSKFPCCIV